MKKLLGGILLLLIVGLGVFLVPTIWFRPWSIDHYYARVFVEFAARHPMMLTQLGMLDGGPLDFHSGRLDDFSVAFQRADARFLDRQIRILHEYDRRKMPASSGLSYDVLDWFLTNQQQGNRFLFHDYPVNQLFGFQSELPDFMISTHPLKRPKDAESFLRRVSGFGVAMDQMIEGLALRESLGVVPPRFVLDKVLVQITDFAGKAPRENPIFVAFAAKLDTLKGMEPSQRQAFEARLETEIRDTVIPAYRRLIATCTHLQSIATADEGVWKLPEGDRYYDWCLQNYTSTTMPADTVHALGLREVDRIQAQVRGILTRQGYPTRDLAVTLRGMMQEPRFHYSRDDSGRAQILAEYQRILDDANQRVNELFDVRPKTGVRVERVPPFKEATAAGAYYQPGSIGGARPGVFFANLRDPNETARPGMRTLAYHEGIPGHHFQLSIAQELEGVPFFRRIVPFTAYAEGWALYAERLALERGFHQDAFDSLGTLQAELFRAVRLVVDTGIHRKRWTREQAIVYMVGNTGMEETEVVTEIERYIVRPGQACAYKVGQLKILELRERAMKRMGDRFDIRKFHNVVLTNGSLPLSLLERVVDEWIAAEGQAATAGRRG